MHIAIVSMTFSSYLIIYISERNGKKAKNDAPDIIHIIAQMTSKINHDTIP